MIKICLLYNTPVIKFAIHDNNRSAAVALLEIIALMRRRMKITMTMAMTMRMTKMMTISSMRWVGAAGDVDTGSILHPATHNFHQTFKTSAHTQFSQKNTENKIQSLPDI